MPTNPTDVLAKSVDDVVVKDVGEEVMFIVVVTNVDVAIDVTVPAVVGVDAVVVVRMVVWLSYSRMFSKNLLETRLVWDLLNINPEVILQDVEASEDVVFWLVVMLVLSGLVVDVDHNVILMLFDPVILSF